LKLIGACTLILFTVACSLSRSLPAPAVVSTPTPPSSPLPSALSSPTVSPTSTAVPKPNDYIVIGQLNLWFHGPGCYGGFEQYNCSGKRSTPFTPALGATYDSASVSVAQQQIDWAAAYGVDAFSIEWTTPRGVGDSLENNLDDAFLKAPNLNKIRWCLFYDLELRLLQTPGLHVDLSQGINFDDPQVYNTFVADFDHFTQKYFGQAQYLKIDGRPVVYIWGTWNARGNFAGAFEAARKKAADQGYDVFIVGDVIRTDVFNSKLAAAYDANTNFVFLIPGLPVYKDVGATVPAVDHALATWQNEIKSLKVTRRQELVNLEPGFTPQFDNRQFCAGVSNANCVYVPATSKDQVTAMAEVAAKYAQPVGSQGWKLIWLNTWNGWAEATTVEPTIDQGPKYPDGNYGFDFLQVIRDVFGPEVFPPN
jgi:hypothetical protein